MTNKSTTENGVNPVKPGSMRPPKKPLTHWALILPALLLGGVVWQSAQENDAEPVKTAVPTESKPRTNDVSPNDKVSLDFAYYAPGDDALLHHKTFTVPMTNTSGGGRTYAAGTYTESTERNIRSLTSLLKEESANFPAGTRLLSPVTLKGKMLIANFNKNFATNAESWSSAEAQMRVYSVVNTLLQTEKPGDEPGQLQVKILVEGKPVEALGPLVASEPFDFNEELVAKDGAGR